MEEKQTILNKLESINEQLNLTHYWIIFLKYKRLILILPLLIGLLGYFIALNILPIFQSNATLVIEEQKKRIVNIEEVYGNQTPGGFGGNINHVNNQIQIIKSDEILNGILSNKETTKKIKKLSVGNKANISFYQITVVDQRLTQLIYASPPERGWVWLNCEIERIQ